MSRSSRSTGESAAYGRFYFAFMLGGNTSRPQPTQPDRPRPFSRRSREDRAASFWPAPGRQSGTDGDPRREDGEGVGDEDAGGNGGRAVRGRRGMKTHKVAAAAKPT